MNTLSWYIARPEDLKKEEEALAAVGVEYTIDTLAGSQGILKIDLTIEAGNPYFGLTSRSEPLGLEAIFPDNYPFFRPEVFAHNVDLPRHFNPFSKNLCLLPRPTDHWEPEWTLAAFLQSQLPKVFEKGTITDPATIAADPAEQAEPVSVYYPASVHPVLFDATVFDLITDVPDELIQIGKIKVGLECASFTSRMAVVESFTMDGKMVGQLPEILKKKFSKTIEGVVLRLSVCPPHGDPAQDLPWLRKLVGQHAGSLTLNRKPLSLQGGEMLKSIIALNFPEEVAPGAQMTRGWLFLIVSEFKEKIAVPKKKPLIQRREKVAFSKVARLGEEELQIRVPEVAGLRQHKIAIVGLGALGGPSVIEFARNQVGELRLLDYDVVEPGPTVRWPLGLASVGLLKSEALHSFLAENYPQTHVVPFYHRIGAIRDFQPSAKWSEQEVMDRLLDGVSMLYDASAESGVNHFLSEFAKAKGIPYVSLHATPGAWGGLVMRVVPGKTKGCWMCLKHWQMN